MSTDSPTKRYQFMIYALDKTEEGTLQRRLAVRERHWDRARKLGAEGLIRFGKALVEPETLALPESEQKMIGSCLVCEATSLEEVKKMVESDIYYTSGVWDPEKIVILPFLGLPMTQTFP